MKRQDDKMWDILQKNWPGLFNKSVTWEKMCVGERKQFKIKGDLILMWINQL